MAEIDDLVRDDPKMQARLRKAEAAFRKQPNGEAPHHDRVVIQLASGRLHEHVHAAEAVLAEASARAPFTGIYARGPMLMRPIRLAADQSAHGIHRKAGALLLVQVERDYLRLRLTELAQWQRFVRREKEWIGVDAPEDVAKGMLASAPWPQTPVLSGIIEAPTLREDGSLLDRPGYDDLTGLLFDPNGTKFPEIPKRPNKAQAEAALVLLLEVFEQFPFVDEASRAVLVSGCITSLVRRRLRSAPLFGFSAPKMASGKSLLGIVISYLATGREPAMITETRIPIMSANGCSQPCSPATRSCCSTMSRAS